MAKVLFISETFGTPDAAGVADSARFEVESTVPTTEQVLGSELVLVLGAISNPARAQQIAGVLRLTVERGATVVVAYPGAFSHEIEIVRALASPCVPLGLGGPQGVLAAHPAFHEYLSIFGRADLEFQTLPDDSEVVGRLEQHSDHPPAAWCRPIGGGALYVIPFYLGGAEGFVAALLDAVRNHRSGATGEVPEFLGDLRVATESELLTAIQSAELELEGLREQASWLQRFRLLIGPLSGDAFEQLAIEALNEVLAGSAYRAEDREDLKVEDFWILNNGAEHALAEAKGIGRHVRREDVNQVDNHRAEQERQVEDLPGLLVVNIFRGDDSMTRRVTEVNADVIRHAVRQNVLILRGIDLYRLVSRKLAGQDAGDELVNALGSGGGWLMVEEEGSELRTE